MSVPTGSAEVTHCAIRDEESATAEQSLIALPLDAKLTVPVGCGELDGPTVAVKVTSRPEMDGLELEVSAVVDAAISTTWLSVPLLPV